MPKTPCEVIYRPAKPDSREWPNWERAGGFYLVTQAEEVIYAYFGCYYKAGEVVTDVIARHQGPETSFTGKYSTLDFAVWHDGRLMAVVHFPMDDIDQEPRIVRFDEGWNMPGEYFPTAMPAWPPREQWVADGADRIIPRAEYVAINEAAMEERRAARHEQDHSSPGFEPPRPYEPDDEDDLDDDEDDGEDDLDLDDDEASV